MKPLAALPVFKKAVLYSCILVVSLLQQQLFCQPVISLFSPTQGPIGSTVTITGSGFSSTPTNNIVFFGATKAAVQSASATSLVVTVPAGASYQPFSVTRAGLTTYSQKPFALTFSGGGAITRGSFAARNDIPNTLWGPPVSITLKDLDNDGKPELVTSTFGNTNGGSLPPTYFISVFKNNSSPGNLALAGQVSFQCPNFNRYTISEDIDGDGKPDVIGGNSVLINTSSAAGILFVQPVNITNDYVFASAVADFDGDGMPDFAATDNERLMSVYRNTSFAGVVSFSGKTSFATGVYPRQVTTAYIDSDNKPDLIVANQSNKSFSVFINTSTPGNISFAARADFATTGGGSPESVAVGDFDNDGKTDVAVANNNNNSIGTVSVFKNVTTGSVASFDSKIDITTGFNWYPYALGVTDIDGDGKPEIVASNQFKDTICVFRNTSTPGTVSFAQKIDLSALEIVSLGLCVGDIDLDGKPDICISGSNSSSLSLFLNKVEAPAIASFSPTNACAGKAITITGNNFTGATAVTLGGVPAASFVVNSNTSITAVVGSGASGTVVVSNAYGFDTKSGFTHTGICSLPPVIDSFNPATSSAGAQVSIKGSNFSLVKDNNIVYFGAVKAAVLSASDTLLIVTVPYGATYKPLTVTVNRLTAYSSKPFKLTFKGGDICGDFTASSFGAKQDFNSGQGGYSLVAADIDGGGLTDIASANFSSNSFSILRNTSLLGQPAFSNHLDSLTGTQPINIFYADLDGDGKQDVVLANSGTNYMSVFKNNSTSNTISYEARKDFTTGSGTRGIFVQDVDLDGKPDVAVTNYSTNTVSVLRNISPGSGTILLDAPVTFPSATGPGAIFIQDVNADNKPDIIVASAQTNTISVFKNSTTVIGSISFDTKIDYTTAGQPSGIFAADLDDDNKPDIAVAAYSTGVVSVLKNTSVAGLVSFANKADYETGGGPFSISVCDFNGDGKADIATSNYFDQTVSVLKNTSNNGLISLSPKIDFIVGSNPRGITTGDIDNDGKTDIITANSGDNTISVLLNKFTSISGEICAGENTIIKSSITAVNYQWQVNTGGGFINISDNSNYSGTNSSTLLLSTVPSLWYGYEYRCIADGNFSTITKLSFVNRFTGTIDSSWENPGNWNCNKLPDENTDVIIGCAHNVQLSFNAVCRSITALPGVIVNVKQGVTLTIKK